MLPQMEHRDQIRTVAQNIYWVHHVPGPAEADDKGLILSIEAYVVHGDDREACDQSA